MKRRILIYAVSLYGFALLQSTLLSNISIFNVKPNLLLIFVVCMSILRGNVEGAVIGFFAGLLHDSLSGKAIGIYAVLGMFTGFIAGSVNRRLFRENLFVCIFSVFVASILYEFSVFIPTLIYNGHSSLGYVLRSIIIPEAFYNSIVSILIFVIAIKMHYKIEGISKLDRKY